MGTYDIREGKGVGYERDGFKCMIKCFDCGKENYAMAVTSGRCAWCGFDANPNKTRKDASRAGGLTISKDRQHMSDIGRRGGQVHSKEHMKMLAARSRLVRGKNAKG